MMRLPVSFKFTEHVFSRFLRDKAIAEWVKLYFRLQPFSATVRDGGWRGGGWTWARADHITDTSRDSKIFHQLFLQLLSIFQVDAFTQFSSLKVFFFSYLFLLITLPSVSPWPLLCKCVAETTVHPDSGSASVIILLHVLVAGNGNIWGFDREKILVTMKWS